MENQKALQSAMLQAVGSKIHPLGFRQNLSLQSFHRRTNFGKQALHISFIPHKHDIDVTADLGIRFDILEDFVQNLVATPFMSERDKKHTFSFGANLGHIAGKGQVRWTIESAADVERESEKIVNEFERVGLPYFEKYSDMCKIFDIISITHREAELLNGIPLKQAKNAIALAHLCGKDHTTFQKTAHEMEAFLRPVPYSGWEEFRDFIDKLSQ